MKTLYLSFILSLTTTFINAQFIKSSVAFRAMNNTPYPYALAGGLNCPQFSDIDLDNDGDKDLVVFDRAANTITPFKNNGTPNLSDYTHAPEWEYMFPKMELWMLLRDYNCDGLEDIFCNHRNASLGYIGIGVYKAVRQPDNSVRFILEKDILFFHEAHQTQLFNVYVSNVDIPAIDDMDNDGDLDILTFDQNGGYMDLYLNESQELGHGCDSLNFVFADNCWGRFYESGMTEVDDLSPRIDSCALYTNWNPIILRRNTPRHAGSTVATLDMDNDGDKECFLGDISFTNITKLTNGGTLDTGFVTNQEVFFPANSQVVDIDIFPAAFFEDVNNDGKVDFLAAPNIDASSFDINNVWLYENTNTNQQPIFDFSAPNFLVNDMIDLGSNSAPTFVDYDSDGLTDIVVGNYGYYVTTGNYKTRLQAFKNIGTNVQPVYMLQDTNFADLQQYNFKRITPTFVDLNNDNDLDIMLGNEAGQLIYVENIGTPTNRIYTTPRANYSLIDVGNNSVPTFGDLDNDGDQDLVIGERNGNLNYFENIGTAAVPNYSVTPTTLSFGYIDTRIVGSTEGNSAPHLIKQNNEFQLFVGTEHGSIWWYNGLENNLLGTFNKIYPTITTDSIDEGRQSIAAIKDINNDSKLDVIIGNRRGGLGLYSQLYATGTNKITNDFTITIYPNPSHTGIFYIETDITLDNNVLRVYNLQGQLISEQFTNTTSKQTLNISHCPSGVYVVQLANKVFKIAK